MNVQDLLNDLDKEKMVVEEETVEIVQQFSSQWYLSWFLAMNKDRNVGLPIIRM